jgi:hypothetical protein
MLSICKRNESVFDYSDSSSADGGSGYKRINQNQRNLIKNRMGCLTNTLFLSIDTFHVMSFWSVSCTYQSLCLHVSVMIAYPGYL